MKITVCDKCGKQWNKTCDTILIPGQIMPTDYEIVSTKLPDGKIYDLCGSCREAFNAGIKNIISNWIKPEPIVEEPIVEEPIVEEPIVEEPIVEEPIVEP